MYVVHPSLISHYSPQNCFLSAQVPQPIPDKGNIAGKEFDAHKSRRKAYMDNANLILKRCDQMIDTLHDFLAEMEQHREKLREAHQQYEEEL